MRMTSLARRYAGALFNVAQERDIVDKVESDLGLITYSLQTMPRLGEVLTHPLIPDDRKKSIVSDIFRENVESITLDFIKLLIDKRRAELLEDVEQEYVKLANEFRGVVTAYITSAIALTPEERSQLQSKLEDYSGRKVELAVEENPDLIGGIIVRIGDTVIDGSVKGYLTSLRDRLLGRE